MSDFNNRARIYYDAEFTGLHQNTTLISVGLVSESGSYFYGEINDYDESQLNEWIENNVLANLPYNGMDTYHHIDKFNCIAEENDKGESPIYLDIECKGSKEYVKGQLLIWLQHESKARGGKKLQIYSDCLAYDWVLLMDLLYGDAINIPDYLDYIPIDLSTYFFMKGINPDIRREKYVGNMFMNFMMKREPFNQFTDYPKHNALWDAWIISECFMRLMAPHDRVYGEVEETDEERHPWIKDRLVMGEFVPGKSDSKS